MLLPWWSCRDACPRWVGDNHANFNDNAALYGYTTDSDRDNRTSDLHSDPLRYSHCYPIINQYLHSHSDNFHDGNVDGNRNSD